MCAYGSSVRMMSMSTRSKSIGRDGRWPAIGPGGTVGTGGTMGTPAGAVGTGGLVRDTSAQDGWTGRMGQCARAVHARYAGGARACPEEEDRAAARVDARAVEELQSLEV